MPKTTRLGRIDLHKNENGEYWFTLKASNYQVIAMSEMYTTKQSMMTGVKSMRRFASSAPIVNKIDKDMAKIKEAKAAEKAAIKKAADKVAADKAAEKAAEKAAIKKAADKVAADKEPPTE